MELKLFEKEEIGNLHEFIKKTLPKENIPEPTKDTSFVASVETDSPYNSDDDDEEDEVVSEGDSEMEPATTTVAAKDAENDDREGENRAYVKPVMGDICCGGGNVSGAFKEHGWRIGTTCDRGTVQQQYMEMHYGKRPICRHV